MCLSFRSIAFRALCPTAVAATYSIKSSRKALIVTACGKFIRVWQRTKGARAHLISHLNERVICITSEEAVGEE